MITHALIVEIDRGYDKPPKYRVCGSSNGKFVGRQEDNFCWLSKHGWLPPLRQNVRFYSNFSSKERAEQAAKNMGATLVD